MNLIGAILNSPGWKSIFSVVIPIITGVLSGVFVAEISTPQGLNWITFYEAKSFYGLFGLTLLTFLYHRAIYLKDKDIHQYLDDDYCKAFVRSQCLPAAAESYKDAISKGDTAELDKAKKELTRLTK